MAEISVLLPCCNCETSLAAALDSLLAQQARPFEIVAVDDGSTDATHDILRRYAAMDARVRAVRLPHQGVAHAMNACAALSRGRYLARMDSDDLCLPGRLEAQAAFLDDRPDIGLVGTRVRFGGDREACAGYAHYVDWINGLTTPEDIRRNRFVESPFAHPSVMYRRETFEAQGGYRQGDFPEDYEFILRWLEAGVGMAKVDRELLVWNDPPTRLSRTDERYAVEAFYRTKTGFLARWLSAHNPFHPRVTVLGAGRTSRRRSDLLLEHGVEIEAYVDIDPRKVGKVIQGRPVLHREALPPAGQRFCLSYVASRGAREDIEDFLGGKGYRTGIDCLMAA